MNIHNNRRSILLQPIALLTWSFLCPRDGAEGGRPEFYKPRNVPFDILETARIVYGAARDVLVVFGPVERKEDGELFPLAQVQEFVIEKRPVRVDHKVEAEVATGASLLYGLGDYSLCKPDGVVDGAFAQKRFSAEERNDQLFLPEGECAFKTYADGLLKCRIVHYRMACGLRVHSHRATSSLISSMVGIRHSDPNITRAASSSASSPYL